MDVGFYLGELLMQQGEASVPGLGHFVQARMSGYFDENEHKFYPPYHQAKFTPQWAVDDDTLAEYIATKKNISVESARYFTERYVDNLKIEALLGEVPVGNIGSFCTEYAELTFKPAAKIADDATFYGLESVSLNKANDYRAAAVVENVSNTFVPSSPVNEEPTPESFETEEETTPSRGPMRAVLFTLGGIIIAGLGALGLYQYQPDTFAKIAFWQQNQPAAKPVPKPVAKPADSLKTDTNFVTNSGNVADTSAKKDTARSVATNQNKTASGQDKAVNKTSIVVSPTPVNPTAVPLPQSPKKKENDASLIANPSAAIGTHRFEVYAFTSGSIADANAAIIKLRKAGLDPRVVTDAADQLIHISIGHFATKQEATDMAAKEINAGHIPGGNAYGIEVGKKDSAASLPTAPPGVKPSFASLIAKPSDAVGTRRVEVYAFTTGNVAEANAAIKKMRKFGLDPRVVTDAPGALIHISIGHFATKDEAKNMAAQEIQAGHIPGGYAYGFEIIPTK